MVGAKEGHLLKRNFTGRTRAYHKPGEKSYSIEVLMAVCKIDSIKALIIYYSRFYVSLTATFIHIFI